MGRPLKIQKYSTNSGVGTPGAAVPIDIGYPNFGSLTDPVYNSTGTLSSADYLGVVGGTSSAAATATNPRVRVTVNITLPSGSGAGAHDGSIIRQKGAHKYLVVDTTSVADESMVVGAAYQIASLGTTNWVACGAPVGAIVGTIFTCKAVGAGTGTVNLVGVCILSNAASPTAGNMSIAWMQDDSSELYLSKLTNKWMLDWTGGSTYSASAVLADVRYAANFFTDEGTVIKSGTTGAANATGQQNLVGLAIIQNYTS
jgi:hypothetical protein